MEYSVCRMVLGHREDFQTDDATKSGSLGVCIVHQSVEFQGNVLIHCHRFGLDSLNREQEVESSHF